MAVGSALVVATLTKWDVLVRLHGEDEVVELGTVELDPEDVGPQDPAALSAAIGSGSGSGGFRISDACVAIPPMHKVLRCAADALEAEEVA